MGTPKIAFMSRCKEVLGLSPEEMNKIAQLANGQRSMVTMSLPGSSSSMSPGFPPKCKMAQVRNPKNPTL